MLFKHSTEWAIILSINVRSRTRPVSRFLYIPPQPPFSCPRRVNAPDLVHRFLIFIVNCLPEEHVAQIWTSCKWVCVTWSLDILSPMAWMYFLMTSSLPFQCRAFLLPQNSWVVFKMFSFSFRNKLSVKCHRNYKIFLIHHLLLAQILTPFSNKVEVCSNETHVQHRVLGISEKPGGVFVYQDSRVSCVLWDNSTVLWWGYEWALGVGRWLGIVSVRTRVQILSTQIKSLAWLCNHGERNGRMAGA